MKYVVRREIIKTLVVSLFLVALVTWRHTFAIEGFLANPILNGTIFIAFLIAMTIAVRSMIVNLNDGVAFSAIKEIFEDSRRANPRDEENIKEMQARVLRPGVVFKHPVLLGHVFDLTTEEMQRTGRLEITIETMHHLSNAVSMRISHERSLLQYITGLLVFLGLIGTFIGLMEMVASVGGIIGNLANGDTASDDAMKELLRQLKEPLVGMATGFSASLFGLFGSLVLGLVGRFNSTVSNRVLEELEAWLAGVSQLDERKSSSPALMAPNGARAVQNDQFAAFANTIVATFERCNLEFGRIVAKLAHLERGRDEDLKLQRANSEALTRLVGATEDIKTIIYRQESPVAVIESLHKDMGTGFGRMIQSIDHAMTRALSGLHGITHQHQELKEELSGLTNSAQQRHSELMIRHDHTHTHIKDRMGALVSQLQALGEADERRFAQVREEGRVHQQGLLHSLETAKTAQMGQIADLGASLNHDISSLRAQTEDGLASTAVRLAAHTDKFEREGLGKLNDIETTLKQTIAGQIGSLQNQFHDLLAKAEADWNARTVALANVYAERAEALSRELRQNRGSEVSQFSESMQGAIREGFDEISKSMTGAFQNYTNFAQNALAAETARANEARNETEAMKRELAEALTEAEQEQVEALKQLQETTRQAIFEINKQRGQTQS